MHKLKSRLADERGFSFLTSAICVVLISITAIGMYNAIIAGNRHISDSRRMTTATNIARAMLEKLADDPECEDYYPQDMELPNMRWEVEYLDSYGCDVPSYSIYQTDPLIIRLTVFWHQDGDSRERFVKLSTKITHGLT